MKEYPIYNMECLISIFEICGYKFTKTHDYNDKVELLYKKAAITEEPDGERWVETIEEHPGTHQHTYTAVWEGDEDEEPLSKIYIDGKLILDILLLWSIWNNRCPITGDRVFYTPHHYYNDKYFKKDNALITAIQHSLGRITNKEYAKSKKLYPVLFLIQESNFTSIWQYKTLFLSPAIDVVSRSYGCQLKDIYTAEEINEIDTLKTDIEEFIKEKQITQNVLENAINPFLAKINSLGSPLAADQVYNWVKWTLDISEEIDIKALKDHCVVFNQFRNSVVHYAGLPGRKIKLRLLNKTFIISQDNRTTCTRVGIYYFFVFREILQLWIAKMLDIDRTPFCYFGRNEVLDFIRYGLWRGKNIFEDEFRFIP